MKLGNNLERVADQAVKIAHRAHKLDMNEPLEEDCALNLLFIARHLERVGDHAKNIGEDAVYAAEAHDIRHPKNLLEVYEPSVSDERWKE